MQTLISVPFISLTLELTSDYDERSTLTSFGSFFQLAGALSVVIAAPAIVDIILASGSRIMPDDWSLHYCCFTVTWMIAVSTL